MTKTNAELAEFANDLEAGRAWLTSAENDHPGITKAIIAALRRVSVTDRGPQVVRYSHGNLYHEPEDIAKPVAEAEGRKS